jgi:hypothetical protein
MFNMLNAIKSLRFDVSDCVDEARFACLRRRLPITYKCIEMDEEVYLFHYTWYDLPDGRSSGYFGLRRVDGKLSVCSRVERDFRRPHFKESVFINGKKLATKADGVRVEQSVPDDAEIMHFSSERYLRHGRPRWRPVLVSVVALPVSSP